MQQQFHFRDRLPQLVDALVEGYRAEERTHHLDSPFLPNRAEIIQILDWMTELLYPGFFGRQSWNFDNVRYHVGELLSRLAPRLHDQIEECLCYEQEGAGKPHGEGRCSDKAAEITLEFLHRVPHLRSMLADDVQAAYDGDPAARNTDEPILCYPGVYAVTVQRVAHELHALGVPLMPRMMTEYAHSITGIDIHPGARIGRYFFIDHGTGVVIGETSEIGYGCKLYQGVTLGAHSFPKDAGGRVIRGHKRHPTLKDHVTIYSNASVLGGETVIGEGAVIGGNVFVTGSVPPHTLVKGTYDIQLISRSPDSAAKPAQP